MDLPAPFRCHGDHIAADLPGGTVLFSTRRGGVSQGPFASLNLGRLTDDSDANVDANRERLAAAVGRPRERFLYGRQVHGDERAPRDRAARARPAGGRGGRAGDGARRRRGARVHRRLPAGDARRRRRRRGAARRLARAGGRDRGRGRRGAARPRRRRLHHRRARPVGARLLLRGQRGRPRALRGLRRAGRRAQPRHRRGRPGAARGGRSQAVHDVGLCTICADPGLFFSHRRDGGVTGRQAGVVWRA